MSIVTPNLARLEPIETIHLELSRDIKFEEIGSRKGLQIGGISGRLCDGVPINTLPPFIYLFCKSKFFGGKKEKKNWSEKILEKKKTLE